VIPRLLQIGDTQVERYLPKTNACWHLDEDVIAIVKSPAHYLKKNYTPPQLDERKNRTARKIEDIIFTTYEDSLKATNIRRDNRVSICVDDQTPQFNKQIFPLCLPSN
jgi:hypothetical protein